MKVVGEAFRLAIAVDDRVILIGVNIPQQSVSVLSETSVSEQVVGLAFADMTVVATNCKKPLHVANCAQRRYGTGRHGPTKRPICARSERCTGCRHRGGGYELFRWIFFSSRQRGEQRITNSHSLSLKIDGS